MLPGGVGASPFDPDDGQGPTSEEGFNLFPALRHQPIGDVTRGVG